jgi:hypothetical protein
MKWFFFSLCLFSTTFASARMPASTHSFASGNALINPLSIQKIVKTMIVQNLQKSYSVASKADGITIRTEITDQLLKIPQKPLLQEIMSTLGIANHVQVQIDPIETSLNFGPESFSLKIDKVGNNLFTIHALWEVNELNAESKSLRVLVPQGMFDTAFVIESSPLKIGLKQGLGPIYAKLSLSAHLTNDGTKITLDHFETNLDDQTARLQVKLGKLTVNGKPLELEIMSNGQSIATDEPTIRAQFQSFGPELMKTAQKELALVIQQRFTDLSLELNNQDPLKITINSSDLLKKYSLKNPALEKLFNDIKTDFVFSYIQELPKQYLFTTQIASKVCIGTQCLPKLWGDSNITTEDTAPMAGKGVGVILYESWVQNVINSAAFQKKVRTYYQTTLQSPGVYLGSNGIKLHFNPTKNAVIAVLNLKIDIKATADASSALSSWSNFKKFSKKQMADLWENIAGSGQYVYLPVEITIKIKGIQKNAAGKRVLALQTEIPLHTNGTITNSYGYPSNIQDMNATIRREVLASVKSEIGKSLPKVLELDLDQPMSIEGIKFNIDQVLISKNKGLLVSGEIYE